MSKSDYIEVEGEVTEVLPNVMFRVMLDNGVTILCQASGRMRRNYIKVLQGDRVKVEMSPYDMSRGRISQRINTGAVQVPVENKQGKKKGGRK